MCQEPQTLNGSTQEVQVGAALSSTPSAFLPPLLEAAFGEIEFLNLLLQSMYTFSIINIFFNRNACTRKKEEMLKKFRTKFFVISNSHSQSVSQSLVRHLNTMNIQFVSLWSAEYILILAWLGFRNLLVFKYMFEVVVMIFLHH